MKRRREGENDTEIRAAIEELSLLHHAIELAISKPPVSVQVAGAGAVPAAPSGVVVSSDVAADHHHHHREVSDIPTRPFVALCRLILQVLDKIGPTMAVLRQDVFQNIQRLEMKLESDPKVYSNVIEIMKKEAAEGRSRKRHSCSKALLWLTRALHMAVALLERVARNPSQRMEDAVEESYNLTLKPWHGWISFAAFKVALRLLPDNKTFIEILAAKPENLSTLKEEIQSMISLLVPLLDDLHFVMKVYGMDRIKHT